MKNTLILYCALFTFLSCGIDNTELKVALEDDNLLSNESPIPANTEKSEYDNLGMSLAKLELVDVNKINPSIKVMLKYSSDDNFMNQQLYDTLETAFLREEVALRLSRCQLYLDSIHPGHFLLVYDAVRPLEVQKQMWNALDTIPAARRGQFVSNPKFGSIHNFGAAVDLTICNQDGEPLDMGAGYDDFREIAFPSKEKYFLASGKLTRAQYENRKLLRKVMRHGGFRGIPSEWWHFNAYSRNYCDSLFEPLLFESGNP